jgi:hypothetical protein
MKLILEINNLKTEFPSDTSKFSPVIKYHATKMYENMEANSTNS